MKKALVFVILCIVAGSLFGQDASLMDSLAYKKAAMIREQIVAGADFGEMAKRFSADPGSRDRGGEIGYMAPGSLVEPYWNAAYDLDIGEISQPVRSEYGYHVIQVLGKKGGAINSRHILILVDN